ncbi:MAG TPA: hypothetical protein H9955_03565 [Candidatus Mediterraneibacter cottocaccae]|nr:hypothetical protein [Candidatus Mediterraneibacter cottocaccae]
MYDTKTRVGLVKRQVRKRKLRHEKHMLRSLSVLCLFLCISLMGAIRAFTGFARPAAPGMYGAILMHEGAGGYVLAGLLAFTAAVLITVLCIRCRKGIKRNIRIKKRHTKEGMRQ